jgi:hypothetical protein
MSSATNTTSFAWPNKCAGCGSVIVADSCTLPTFAKLQRIGVCDGAQGPHQNRQLVCELGADSVHQAAGEQQSNRVDQLEGGGDVRVIGVRPSKFLRQGRCQQAEDAAWALRSSKKSSPGMAEPSRWKMPSRMD